MRARRLALGSLALGAGLSLAPRSSSRADELSAADRLRVIYSHAFSFTDDGLPLVSVRLMEGQTDIRITSGGPGGDAGEVRVLPDGAGGPTLQDGPSWHVRIESSTPAVVHYWVIVDQAPTRTRPDYSAAVATWKTRGLDVRTFDEGTMFGVGAAVLDSRRTVLAVGPKPTEAEALDEAHTLAQTYGLPSSEVYPELVQPPSGTLIVTPDDGASSPESSGNAGGANGLTLRIPGIVWFQPASDGGLLTVRDVAKGGGGSSLAAPGHEDRSYFGSLYVVLDEQGQLAVVNEVPEDKLLEGLLPQEIGASAPAQALEAQAVTARGELLAKIGLRHVADPYVLCASEHCQVYGGAGKEDPRSTAAVEATRGEVLLRQDGSGIVDSVYSANCGGVSEDNDLVWDSPADPVLRGHPDGPLHGPLAALGAADALSTDEAVRAFLALPAKDTWCGQVASARASYRWQKTIDAGDLATLVGGVGTRVTSIQVDKRGVSGRAIDLTVVGDGGQKPIHGELSIRRALGGLKSSLFVVDPQTDASGAVTAFSFTGGGFGHGVGMCQDGAVGMAQAGASYQDILAHYYPGSTVTKLY
jgi:SpoIID/LytB domain protein